MSLEVRAKLLISLLQTKFNPNSNVCQNNISLIFKTKIENHPNFFYNALHVKKKLLPTYCTDG
ncbi:hypothetical protein [Sulfurospirillum diekertiae]|uniref:hypothetical protein n=1 Tax=Sulfurospirillum diekertiae TaxID=1854492 RepID=UPI0010FE3FDC|nr:hypothetical protein [Sulfurospirillum diekertiae]